jgi:hypothetical protein
MALAYIIQTIRRPFFNSSTILILLLCFTAVTESRNFDSPLKSSSKHEEQVIFSPENGVVHDLEASVPTKDLHFDTVPTLVKALDVMQNKYFELWQGTWPSSIDWTAAVLGTHVSATLSTLSVAVKYVVIPDPAHSSTNIAHENVINEYFSQLIASYFGQDAFRLRNEANDDMLWVVLGWLESIKFVQLHSNLHYKGNGMSSSFDEIQSRWYGNQWIPSFAHRARVFWELASKGWDTKLCDGGMIWSPYLLPYKNAITNELYISASIEMYLNFPGDTNTNPFSVEYPPVGPRDPKYLMAAIEAYRWLKSSNMTNAQGLYVDGYHISGWQEDPVRNTKCDERNEMVYTYNQGVILSGQRGLWEATGSRSYLEDGHLLISNVINATGYDLKSNKAYDNDKDRDSYPHLGKWYGLGRFGVMEDTCDAFGYCSQNGQTFKGIFFHHLTLFCTTLTPQIYNDDQNITSHAKVQKWHASNCAKYGGWIRHNAGAALSTVDEDGKFGTWWGAPRGQGLEGFRPKPKDEVPDHAVDYRNEGVPNDGAWKDSKCTTRPCEDGLEAEDAQILPLIPRKRDDANDRGRGRTVETQAGGIAVLRALWELVELPAAKGT